jgi:(p)ppGpp synthase/HD superfamily hydrolase
MSVVLERALRFAADRHRGQNRKGSVTPYVEHVYGVALILERLGFEEEVVVAGLLHDVVEDTETSLEDLSARFGESTASLVDYCSEVKLDSSGAKRPWEDRKRDHLASLALAPLSARAIVLADKLHNLVSILCDLQEGRPVWSVFNAERSRVLWYYEASIAAMTAGEADHRLGRLAEECRRVLEEVRSFPEAQ